MCVLETTITQCCSLDTEQYPQAHLLNGYWGGSTGRWWSHFCCFVILGLKVKISRTVAKHVITELYSSLEF